MENREWYIHSQLLVGDEAEKYLKHKSQQFIVLRDDTIETLEGILEFLKESKTDNHQTYKAYRSNVWNLGEVLSITQTSLEMIVEDLEEL